MGHGAPGRTSLPRIRAGRPEASSAPLHAWRLLPDEGGREPPGPVVEVASACDPGPGIAS
eukprot:5230054-Alexandrium_andersonii.AAC.1